MKKILFSLSVIALVSVISIGGTLAYFSASETRTITMSSATVSLGEIGVSPFDIEGLAPGKEVTHDFTIEYTGSETANLYIGAKTAECLASNCKDMSPVLEYRLEETWESGAHKSWVTYENDPSNSNWMNFDGSEHLLREWRKTHSSLTNGDTAYGKLYLRMKTDVEDINDYQNSKDKFDVIFYAEQETGDGPEGFPYDHEE